MDQAHLQPGQPRRIDQDERVRKKDMKVLVLGMPRTDTASLAIALRRLGYTPHSMRELLIRPSEIPLWNEAAHLTLLTKSRLPPEKRLYRPYGRAEFDKLLGDFDVAMDLPSCVFAKDLVEAYPEAKVILTHIKYEDWEASMQVSIWALLTWKLFNFCRTFNLSQMAPLLQLLHSLFTAHNGNVYDGPQAKEAYEAHYEKVRQLVPKDRLLELNNNKEWEPLCKFLGKDEVPEDVGAYPRVEEGSQMKEQMTSTWWGIVQHFLFVFVIPALTALLATALVYWRTELFDLLEVLMKKAEAYISV
ncbi:hypothetical protein BU24DRAFT_210719 [Aaosphaeria arxii CBS 175.79]|uniref:NAD dependent epimerase/dehydratase n=1 Tax=Aaosphaeria arxii CBS 175.79 TaxID=1450172 RepID=A0A6A5XLH3_9PLEO|nr:uncharacterized protein BU24DRAFT_210719 [Aaosphaeria arxii CBS 175.79]KAF2014128.1 hypothetical protein BU24DRAFT_210719 [Aaosphaeria arxii CBS 175.79]